MSINCPCTNQCTCTWGYHDDKPKTTMQNISDRSDLLQQSIAVPRDSKLLARKTVADHAKNADDCRMLLEVLGLMDLETLPEPT